jgi:choline dehydrogenase-like flavoprotein
MSDAEDRALLRMLYATFAPADAPATGADRLCDAVERLAPERRVALATFLRLLRSPAGAMLADRRPLAFERRTQPERERLLRALADHPISPLRAGFLALKRLALFCAYAADDEGRNAAWERIGYPGPAPRPVVGPSYAPRPHDEIAARYDAIVVGSGAGGGVAAALLARAGMRVLVVEAGPWPSDVMARGRELDAFAELYLESGLCASDDLGVAILAGSCAGGGTTVNWATALRLRPAVERAWERAGGGALPIGALDAHYAALEERMGCAPAPVHNANNRVISRGCAQLGWTWTAHPRNAVGCDDRCGYCGFGCPAAHKRSTFAVFLADAVHAGADLAVRAPARRVVIDGGRAVGVEIAFENGTRVVAAERVVVAAGALRTPALLAASGVRSAHLGRHLHLHPAAAIVAEFGVPIEPWRGPMQSVLSDAFAEMEGAYGVTFEAVPAHPGLAAMALPWRSRAEHAEQMTALRTTAALIALLRDRGEGQVGLEPPWRIRYRLRSDDARRLRNGLARLAECAIAAGALRVQTLREGAPNRLSLFSAHQMGTARMHAKAAHGVTDGEGRVHGVRGLSVADASLFPEASGVNPMLTIMALARRCASAMIR